MQRNHVLMLIGSVLLAAFLMASGCSPQANRPKGSFSGETLNVFNWSDYIDPDLIKEFEKRTGARVQYDKYSSDAELEAKIVTSRSSYDVIFPSDRSIVPLLKKNALQKIDKNKLSNFIHLNEKFLNQEFDPKNQYSVPYFWGTVAVGIRSDHVTGEVKGLEVLFDKRYKGRITMLDDAENVVAVLLMHLGYPLNSTKSDHLAEVEKLLKQQRELVLAYTSDAYKEKLISGEAWVVLGWSGDILQAAAENKNIKAVIPTKGTMIWMDNMAIPKHANNEILAHRFVNFLLEPKIAARNAKFVRYATPNSAAKSLLEPDLLTDPAVYPPTEILSRCEWLLDRGSKIEKIEKLWERVRN